MITTPPADDALISSEEADALLAPLRQWPVLALAVSGGGDSLALMHLAVDWAKRVASEGAAAPRLHVLTVDHGLQAHSTRVAQDVCRRAARLGLPCAVLRWRGEKPASGIEEAARGARYDLMARWCARHRAALVTAHTLEDQFETFLMRLARGSGLDGLCAMAEQTRLPASDAFVPLLRPLLTVSRTRLRATLRGLGEQWHEDPANRDARFERVRWRRLLPLLREAGITPRAIAAATRRLHRARAALERQVEAFLRAHVAVHPTGHVLVERSAFEDLPEEMRLRALAELMGRLGGTGGRLRDMAGLERLLAWLQTESGRARVLAGAHLARRKRALVIGREPGRPGPEALLPPGESTTITWDNRYRIEVANLHVPLRVMMLARALKHAPENEKDLPTRPAHVPAFAWRAQPALVRGAETTGERTPSPVFIAALPAIGWHSPDAPFDMARAKFLFPGGS